VRKFAAEHAWIDLVSLPRRAERNFAGKVAAFNAGQAKVAGLKYDVIGNLDADISFDKEYFDFLLQKLAENPALGLVGTPYRDPLNDQYDYRYVSIDHVTGPCQLFRCSRSDSHTDRKSTRLNSSHGSISYAVFCLKNKTQHK